MFSAERQAAVQNNTAESDRNESESESESLRRGTVAQSPGPSTRWRDRVPCAAAVHQHRGAGAIVDAAATGSTSHANTTGRWSSAANKSIGRVALVLLSVGAALAPQSAWAQFQPRPLSDPATGERYHIEAAAGFWFPVSDLSIASQSLGIVGSTIDFKRDLGLTDQHFPELHLELRATPRNKFRLQYIPIKFDQSATLTRNIIFNGQAYRVGLPVSSTLDWKAYRIGYEYDFISRNRGFGGVILDFKFTDVTATLSSAIVNEFTRAKAPIPAIGGIFRFYVVPNISITGEVSGFNLPEKIVKNATGHYLDVNTYGTLNFTNNIGVQVGYRLFDVGYAIDTDSGSFTLQGVFFGLVARY
jgi:hypothetical protein